MDDKTKRFLTDPKNVELLKDNNISKFIEVLDFSDLTFSEKSDLIDFMINDAGIDVVHNTDKICSGFMYNKRISSLHIPENVYVMGIYAVQNCSIETLVFDEDVEFDSFYECPFFNCRIQGVFINCPASSYFCVFSNCKVNKVVVNSRFVQDDTVDQAPLFVQCTDIESIHLTQCYYDDLNSIIEALFDDETCEYIRSASVPIYINKSPSPSFYI